MKTLLVASAIALFATPVLAVPYCDLMTDRNGMIDVGFGPQTEDEAAQQLELQLVARGIHAHQSRFWNGCLQTFVGEGGHDQMKFYDPDTLEEVPVD